MSRFPDVQTEWRISAIEREVQQKASSHEIYSIRGEVDRLEHSLREASADIAWLRAELQACQAEIHTLKFPLE